MGGVIDNRMVHCVLDGYIECPAKTPEACICYQFQKTPDDPKVGGNMYERMYRAKYGADEMTEGFGTTTKARKKGLRKIAISMPGVMFERISARARAAKEPFTVAAVRLLECGLMDYEDSERHEPDWPHMAPP